MQKIEVVHDHVAEKLDEMAELCEHWKRHRERGRNPSAIRAALLMLAQECSGLTNSPTPTAHRSLSAEGGYQPAGGQEPTMPPPRKP